MPRAPKRGTDRKSRPLPRLDGTTAGVESYLRWVRTELAAGRISTGEAQQHSQTASKMLTRIQVDAGLREMAELRELVRRQESALAARRELAVADRHSGGAPPIGEIDLSGGERN